MFCIYHLKLNDEQENKINIFNVQPECVIITAILFTLEKESCLDNVIHQKNKIMSTALLKALLTNHINVFPNTQII